MLDSLNKCSYGVEAKLEEAFNSIGKKSGFVDIVARFAPYKEFKNTWKYSNKSIQFNISDYMKGASYEVLEDLAISLYSKLSENSRKTIYTPTLLSWLKSKEFIEQNQALYLHRSRNLSLDHQGEVYDLQDAYISLKDQGFVDDCPDAVLNWTIRNNRRRVGYCSILMQVVAISSILDSIAVPPYVSEYVLYHELLHLQDGFRPDRRYHNPDFRRRERLYPHWKESEEWLRRLSY
ncbi:MAG: M48 family metallopeptidase [Euryarchaeota archaeon]|nr:M48 family metallopeptidase [Euryarchaeota archaeon]